MDSKHDEKRMNAECRDRLSNLSDDIIHNIFSFLEITQAIITSELSSRWRYMWTSMPSLSFSSENFDSLPEFSEFVTDVLSRRNDQIDVSYVKLTFRDKISKMIVKRISTYMFSHNVQQLDITCLEKIKYQVPILDFISHSLQSLTLTGDFYNELLIATPNSWELPTLTILNLHNVILHYYSTDKSDALFSNFPNLRNLTIRNCEMKGLNVLKICHPGLTSLALENGCWNVIVVAPQLKNLIIKDYRDISLELCEDFFQLEKVDICLSSITENVDKIVSLLQQIRSVKFLSLNSVIIESLSSSVELISHQPSPFANLKSLKIYPAYVLRWQTLPEVSMSTKVKNFLLDSSPGATLKIVTHEDIRVMENVVSTYRLMRELQVVLDGYGKKCKTDMTNMATDENHMAQPDMEAKLSFEERMAHIKCYWQSLSEQTEKNYRETIYIVSKLQIIKEAITKLPTSNREKLLARFSRLCAEADTVMVNMKDHTKMQCDKKLTRLDAYFHELATSSNPSS